MSVEFHDSIDASRAINHVEYLAECGPRYAASSNEAEAISYIEKELRKVSSLVSLQETKPIISWKEKDSRLKVVEPIKQELSTCAILGSPSTPPGGITAKLVYGKRGFPGHYENIDLENKIVLHDPPRARTLDNRCGEGQPQRDITKVINSGAKALIEHARLPGRYLQRPLLAGRKGMEIPAVSTTYQDGQYLKELLREWYSVPDGIIANEKFDVTVEISVDTESKMRTSSNVIATKKGDQLPSEKVLLVAHHDNALGPGANDNAAASSILLETARAIGNLSSLKRTVEFVSVTGEEYGQAGTKDYIESLGDSLENIKGVIVLDLVGSGDKYYYITKSLYEGELVENSSQINSKIEEIANSLGFEIQPTILEFASDDGPFIEEGIPTSYICRCISKSWPWLHTYQDNPDVVDPNALKVVAEIVTNTIVSLAEE